jgi:hypothetical protein
MSWQPYVTIPLNITPSQVLWDLLQPLPDSHFFYSHHHFSLLANARNYRFSGQVHYYDLIHNGNQEMLFMGATLHLPAAGGGLARFYKDIDAWA